ncbi:hypothetical protein [Zavarzinella formosa]|uniref:hypothetical protein n=1 Tax=Zavarzinella formosa TaxID=360055 RepID=UPI000594C121|nr:hypothetical protein [Zavarzinella formosa]
MSNANLRVGLSAPAVAQNGPDYDKIIWVAGVFLGVFEKDCKVGPLFLTSFGWKIGRNWSPEVFFDRFLAVLNTSFGGF